MSKAEISLSMTHSQSPGENLDKTRIQ